MDLCGTTWPRVFGPGRGEAAGFVTLSCYPHAYSGKLDAPREDLQEDASCESTMKGDVRQATCEDWCSVASAKDHCRWCKCRACPEMASICAAVVSEVEKQQKVRAAFFARCGRQLDCKSWCNSGNCDNCVCAACERCGPPPPKRIVDATLPAKPSNDDANLPQQARHNQTQPSHAQPVSAACHGWCLVGGKEDPDVVCKSSKCWACPLCEGHRAAAGGEVSA